MTAPGAMPPLWAVVAAYDVECGVGAVLGAVVSRVGAGLVWVVVDTASTAAAVTAVVRRFAAVTAVAAVAAVVRRFAADAPFTVRLVREEERGAGAAVGTGFGYAVAQDAGLLVRTDADCRPAADWIAAACRGFVHGTKTVLHGTKTVSRRTKTVSRRTKTVCGRGLPRRGGPPSLAKRCLLPAAVRATALCGCCRAVYRLPRLRAPYVLCHGHSPALTAALYVRCGGTLRVSLEGAPEGVVLLDRARGRSDRIVRAERMAVDASLRRLRAWGARRTLSWWWDSRCLPSDFDEVHVR
ncbi:hypothetical protein [Streptomyces fradiae]|uniref:hypothetical protein n=1 Tax=Streptomyces fradiae TaxID=1906 RepID=UPI003986569F